MQKVKKCSIHSKNYSHFCCSPGCEMLICADCIGDNHFEHKIKSASNLHKDISTNVQKNIQKLKDAQKEWEQVAYKIEHNDDLIAGAVSKLKKLLEKFENYILKKLVSIRVQYSKQYIELNVKNKIAVEDQTKLLRQEIQKNEEELEKLGLLQANYDIEKISKFWQSWIIKERTDPQEIKDILNKIDNICKIEDVCTQIEKITTCCKSAFSEIERAEFTQKKQIEDIEKPKHENSK